MPGAASPVFLLKGGEAKMIDVTKVNGKKFTLNSRLIETIEETPDTVITLTTGKKIRGIIRMCEQVAASGNTLILYSA